MGKHDCPMQEEIRQFHLILSPAVLACFAADNYRLRSHSIFIIPQEDFNQSDVFALSCHNNMVMLLSFVQKNCICRILNEPAVYMYYHTSKAGRLEKCGDMQLVS